MRMLMKVIIPNQPFNALVKRGKAGATIKRPAALLSNRS
jgi:hypothetical protein